MNEFIYTVTEIFNSKTRAGCLHQNGCTAFNIPSYQRGYKWGSETNQPVERLFSDLFKAWNDGLNEYLVLAITVKRIPRTQTESVLEVIDGQQRLTTLFILLHALNSRIGYGENPSHKLQYSIRHEAASSSASLDELVISCIKDSSNNLGSFEQLKASLKVNDEARQDHYYLKCAVLRCVYELCDKSDKGFSDNEKVSKFRDFILTKTKLLVNVVEPHIEGEVLFGNLNSNRVVLTETELIKGLLLTRVARESSTKRPRQYREVLEARIYLGRKWDEIYRWANQPEIRSLYFPDSDFKDGMTGLLQLVAMQMDRPYIRPAKEFADTKPLFEHFLTQRKWDYVLSLLTNTHASLDDWYRCTNDYHLLGYALLAKTSQPRTEFLIKLLKFTTKTEVANTLLNERKKLLCGASERVDNPKLGELFYGDGKDHHIKNILLALSVFREQKSTERFDFLSYKDKDEGWTLEHIFPQTPFGKGAKLTSAQENAAFEIFIDNIGSILPEETVSTIAELSVTAEDPGTKKIQIAELLKKVKTINRIGNLCLLSSKDNSAMGCGMFDDKRKTIRDRIARGSFVPLHTYEVFSKMIVGENTGINVWCKADICAHEEQISARLQKLIEEGL